MGTHVKYDFNTVISRLMTNSEKHDAAFRYNPELPDNFLSMTIADMDFPCPPPVLQAIKDRLEHPMLGYTLDIDYQYRRSIVGWLKRRHGWIIDPTTMVTTTGVCRALFNCIESLTKKTDGVIIQTPIYYPFYEAITAFNRTPIYNHLVHDEKGYYTIDFDDFEKKCKDPKNKLFLLCSPHNPTGRVWKEEELRRMAEICFANNVFIVCDEIHSDIIRTNQKHIPLGKLYPDQENMIFCTSPSKTFNLAGNELANIFIPKKLLWDEWESKFYTQQPNPLSMEALKAAYTKCDDWLEQIKIYLDDNFKHLDDRLNSELPESVFYPSEGTYLAWIDLSKFGLSDDELKRRITRAGLYVEYAGDFAANGEGHIRMNLACPRSILDQGIDLLVKCLKENYEDPQYSYRFETGKKMIDFSFTTLSNETKKLSQFFNENNNIFKSLFLFMRSIKCPISEFDIMNLINDLTKETQEKGFEGKNQIFVVFPDDHSSLKKFFDGKSINFDVVSDSNRELYQLLSIKPAVNSYRLYDALAVQKLIKAENSGIERKKIEDLQRTAYFVINSSLEVVYSHYGIGAGDTPSACQIIESLK
ncbi:hypothetical protein TRFO_36983 [Tritrichomonas foetus]|uniref:cysteine-S-conjugate beta-lyase n=1 Tax=Tritrichomonas foetus TaxID=1144522 RepID=A0A1J4JCC5_9EUKA|nr:hypothetical protein TRFO_36983 [Tritrichomonas foetus]|eukprot:OHS96792.1 hypothetical protein TRFO_36983 [Tritrichomonas foetus]